jgi:hypothetical protein
LASGVVESFSDTLEWIESVVYNPWRTQSSNHSGLDRAV